MQQCVNAAPWPIFGLEKQLNSAALKMAQHDRHF